MRPLAPARRYELLDRRVVSRRVVFERRVRPLCFLCLRFWHFDAQPFGQLVQAARFAGDVIVPCTVFAVVFDARHK